MYFLSHFTCFYVSFSPPKFRSCVIGLLKKNTSWYVVARAIREKAAAECANRKKSPGSTYTTIKWEDQITQIQKGLGFSDTYMNAWIALGNGFISWLMAEQKKSGKTIKEDLKLHGKFPILWKRYLAEHNLSDKIEWNWNTPNKYLLLKNHILSVHVMKYEHLYNHGLYTLLFVWFTKSSNFLTLSYKHSTCY